MCETRDRALFRVMATFLHKTTYLVLESCLDDILSAIKPSEEDRLLRLNVISSFRTVVGTVESLRGATVEPFGSFVSNLYSKWGDLDLSIEPSRVLFSSVERSRKQNLLREIMRALRRRGASALEFIPRARVPLLKFKSSQNISCDISVDNLVGQIKSKCFLWISDIDGRFRDMVLLVKEWAKAQNINDPKNGTLNSYSLTLLVIFHFQTCQPPILPPLKTIFDGNIADHLSGRRSITSLENTCTANITTFKYDRYRQANQSSLAQLFISFFDKFSNIRAMSTNRVISTYAGKWQNSWLAWIGKPYSLIIEDPFEQQENAARSVGPCELVMIAEAFEETHRKLVSPSILSEKNALIPILVRPSLCSALGVRIPQLEYRNQSQSRRALHGYLQEGAETLPIQERFRRSLTLQSLPSSSRSSESESRVWRPLYDD